ncbi:MAG TPA: hypothetical protein VGE07_24515 [Herpetosiphonaceae bacterium]
MTSLAGLLEYHGAASLDKQWALSDLIGDADWQVSISQGTITFGGEKSFPIQVLGTESQGSGTWLWSWANAASNLPPAVVRAAEELRDWGAEHGIPELTEAELSLEAVSGHLLSMIAAGVLSADCYYRGPYEGGAVFLLLEAPELRERLTPAIRIINVFVQLISTFEVDHRRALLAYLQARGYECEARGDELVGFNQEGSITFRFDDQDRFVSSNVHVGGRA